jgi:arylsulfatase
MIKNSGIAGLLLAATNLAYAGSQDHANKSPVNVVLLIADDLRWNSLGCAGNPVVSTPEIDRLSKDGIRFSNAHVTTSICMVSRASILTGQYMNRHGITGFLQPLSDEAIANTYPAVLRNAGYYTGYIGKYGVGHIKPGQFDFATEYEGKHWIRDEKGDSIHVTQKNLNDALGFLKNRPQGKPFCLTVGFFATHAEDNHPDQYRFQPKSESLFRNVMIPVPETATPEYLKMLPPFISSEENEGRRRWHWRFDTPEKYQRYMKAYYRMLAELDEAVGDITGELKKEGVYNNTMIIFIGDNGYFQGEHQLADKWYPYEESIRIPLVVYDPRIPVRIRGTANGCMVLNIDIAPAIIAAAGIAVPEEMQGRDFSILYRGRKSAWRTDFFYEHPVVMNAKRIPASQAIVAPDAKYIWWPDYQYEEYFDLGNDPLEEKNRISDPAYAGKIESLKQRFMILKAAAK